MWVENLGQDPIRYRVRPIPQLPSRRSTFLCHTGTQHRCHRFCCPDYQTGPSGDSNHGDTERVTMVTMRMRQQATRSTGGVSTTISC